MLMCGSKNGWLKILKLNGKELFDPEKTTSDNVIANSTIITYKGE